MSLILNHPRVALRDCDHCKKWLYNEETGKIEQRRGKDVPRATPPPCEFGNCPKGSPDAGIELSAMNWQAYRHYQECRATGRFPDDPIVARNAGIIRRVEDSFDRARTEYLHKLAMMRTR